MVVHVGKLLTWSDGNSHTTDEFVNTFAIPGEKVHI